MNNIEFIKFYRITTKFDNTIYYMFLVYVEKKAFVEPIFDCTPIRIIIHLLTFENYILTRKRSWIGLAHSRSKRSRDMSIF